MESARAANLLAWLITLGGGVVLIGAVAALSKDAGSPTPYKLAWTAIALEVFSLLVALYALTVGPYKNWKPTVLAMFAVVTAVIMPITNSVLEAKSALPGSNGSDSRANCASAGLIIVMVGNFLQILLAATHSNDSAPAAAAAADASPAAAGKDLV